MLHAFATCPRLLSCVRPHLGALSYTQYFSHKIEIRMCQLATPTFSNLGLHTNLLVPVTKDGVPDHHKFS